MGLGDVPLEGSEISGMIVPNRLKIFGREIIDDGSIGQIKNCIGEKGRAVLTAYAYYGFGHPIGGTAAYREAYFTVKSWI